MSSLRALLVDLDGTLVDTRGANFAAYAAALGQVGVVLDRDWWNDHGFGRTWRQFLPELLAQRRDVVPSSVAAAKARIYPHVLGQSRVNRSLAALIETVRPRVATALVTTAAKVNAEAILAHHSLGGLFDAVVTGDDVTAHKPAPDAYAKAARLLGVTADQCLVLEDSSAGLAAARAFGAPVHLVTEFAC